MKYTLPIVALAWAITSCGNNDSEKNNSVNTLDSSTTDSVKNAISDSLPGEKSSSTSEFSKSATSPAGSTGVVDTSGKKPDKKN